MTKTSMLAALLAATALTACGTTSITTGDSEEFFIGTVGADASNGLPFASEESSAEDAAGLATIPFIYATHDSETDEHALLLRYATAENDFEAETITVNLNGLEYLFTPEEFELGSYSAETEDGADLYLYFYGDGRHATRYNMYGTFADDTEFDGMGVVGLQTDPTTIAGLSDEVEYFGDLEGWGNFIAADGSTDQTLSSVDGSIYITVFFGRGDIAGTLEVEELYAYDALDEQDYTDAAFSFEDQIIGNGFEAELSLYCSEGFTCNGGGTIGGAFFGPNAEEVGGIAGLTGTVAVDGNPDGAITFEHPIAFVGGQEPSDLEEEFFITE